MMDDYVVKPVEAPVIKIKNIRVETLDDLMYKYSYWNIKVEGTELVLHSSMLVEHFLKLKRDANFLGYTVRIDG